MDEVFIVGVILVSIFGTIFALRYAIRFIAIFISFSRAAYWPTKVRPLLWRPQLEGDELEAVHELAALGFRQIAANEMETGPLSFRCVLLQHETLKAYAFLSFQADIEMGFRVQFFSFAADGATLLTVNRVILIGAVPKAVAADALASSLADHWEFHKARIAEVALVCPEPGEANRLTSLRMESALPSLIEGGVVIKSRDNAWHPNFRSALRMTRAWLKAHAAFKKPYQSALTQGQHRSAFFARAYEELEAVSGARARRRSMTVAVLLVTLALYLAFRRGAGTWEYAVIATAVLLVHETGHALAMKAFGYRDISMFFIPFFGAAVTGTPRKIAAWKQAIVLLAGPLPGLIAGLGFFLFRGLPPFEGISSGYGRIAAVAVALNLFNLLPLTPLDGGQLLNISLFRHWPRARLVFAAFSTIGFSLLAAYLQKGFLAPIVLFLWLNLFGQWRLTDIERAWKEGLSPREQLANLFEAARLAIGPLPFRQQYPYVRGVILRSKIDCPRPWESILAVSLMLLIWGCAGTAAVSFRLPATAVAIKQEAQRPVPAARNKSEQPTLAQLATQEPELPPVVDGPIAVRDVVGSGPFCTVIYGYAVCGDGERACQVLAQQRAGLCARKVLKR